MVLFFGLAVYGFGFLVDPEQFDAACTLFSKATFNASNTREHLRRYEFPGFLGTCVIGMPDVEKSKLQAPGSTDIVGARFHNLPLLCGRAILLGYYAMVAEAGKEGDKARLKKLFEAGLSPFVKMRLGDSLGPGLIDVLSNSERLRSQALAGCADYVQFSRQALHA